MNKLGVQGIASLLLLSTALGAAASVAFRPTWVNSIGSVTYDSVGGLARDAQGNLVFAGGTGQDFPGSLGNRGGVVRKLTSGGKVVWTALIGTWAKDDIFGMTLDKACNVFVVGTTSGALQPDGALGGEDAFVAKLTPGGKVAWIKQFGTALDDSAQAVALGPDGSILVMGNTKGTLPNHTPAGGQDTFVVKLSSDGTEVWTQQIGNEFDDFAEGIAVDAAGRVYAAGSVGADDQANYDAFLVQFGAKGAVQWAKTYAQGGQTFVRGLAVRGDVIVLVGDTDVVLPGQTSAGPGKYGTNDDGFVIRVNTQGEPLWTRQFGGTGFDAAFGASITENGAVVVTGLAEDKLFDQNGQGEYDVFVSQYTSGGNRLWTRLFGTPKSDIGYEVVPANDALFVAGVSHGAMSGKPSVGDQDTFVARLPFVPGTGR